MLVEPDGEEVEKGEYSWKEDDSDESVNMFSLSVLRNMDGGLTVSAR